MDPSQPGTTLRERVAAKRRAPGATFDQVVQHLGWDPATLNRYVREVWCMKPDRAAALAAFLSAALQMALKLPRQLGRLVVRRRQRAGPAVRVHALCRRLPRLRTEVQRGHGYGLVRPPAPGPQ